MEDEIESSSSSSQIVSGTGAVYGPWLRESSVLLFLKPARFLGEPGDFNSVEGVVVEAQAGIKNYVK